MPNNTNPAWRGGARQKVSFWSNVSADSKEPISGTQACSRPRSEVSRSHHDRARSGGAEGSSRRSHETPEFIGDATLERATMAPNVVQRGDALTLLRSLPEGCAPLVFFDPQHRAVLDKLKFGNEGARQRGRAELPAMSESYIDDCCRESVRVLAPSGYLMRWVDTYTMFQDWHLRIAGLCQPVDLIAWDSLRIGNGYRSRRRGDYLVILQKPPITAKNWRDHSIPSRWPEKVDRKIHPHIKPIGLITRLIGAVTQPGDLAVDPAAGSFVVMRAAHQLGRNFIGCDLKLPALTRVGFVTEGLNEI